MSYPKMLAVPAVALFLCMATSVVVRADNYDLESQLEYLKEAYKGAPSEECLSAEPMRVVFNLFTRDNPLDAEALKIDNFRYLKSISRTGYNVKKPTKFLIHGYLQSVNETREMIVDYLFKEPMNIIVVDWSIYAKKCNLRSIRDVIVPTVSVALVKLMKQLMMYGSTAETDFHIVGCDIGAHIAAHAAKRLSPVKFYRISALNPVGYIFDEPGAWKLQNTDAFFVDVFYTSKWKIGSTRDIGHVNFYPNGGDYPNLKSGDEDSMNGSLRSILLWRKSILKPIKAWLCDNYVKYKAGECTSVFEYMGEYISQKVRGNYFVDFDYSFRS